MFRVVVFLAWMLVAEASTARCMKGEFISGLRSAEQAELCSLLPDSNGPIACFKSLWGKVGKPNIFSLCSTTSELTLPFVLDCVEKNIYLIGKPDLAVELCAHARSEEPSRCFQKMRSETHNLNSIVALCKQFHPEKYLDDSLGVIDCFRQATQYNLKQDQVISLCQQGNSLTPFLCSINFGLLQSFNFDDIVRLCAIAKDLHPAECASKCAPKNAIKKKYPFADSACLQVCTNSSSIGPGICLARILEKNDYEKILPTPVLASPSVLVTLGDICKGSNMDGPVECLLKLSPEKDLDLNNKIQLCKGTLKSDPIIDRIRCFKLGPRTFDVFEKIQLCNGKITGEVNSGVGPSRCANDLIAKRLSLSNKQIIQLCKANGSPSRTDKDAQTRVECFLPVKVLIGRSFQFEDEFVRAFITICRIATSNTVTPSSCLLNIAKLFTSVTYTYHQHVDRDTLTTDLVRLCGQSASDVGPIECSLKWMKDVGLTFEHSSRLCSIDAGGTEKYLSSVCCAHNFQKKFSKHSLESQNHIFLPLCSSASLSTCAVPSQCLAAIRKVKSWNATTEILLCEGAISTYPVSCVQQLTNKLRYLSNDNILRVCSSKSAKNFPSFASGPAECMLETAPLHSDPFLSVDLFIDLCTAAISGGNTASCFTEYIAIFRPSNSMKRDLFFQRAVTNLCKKGDPYFSVDCIQNSPLQLNDDYARERLCVDIKANFSETRGACAKFVLAELESKRFKNDIDFITRLCGKANGIEPAQCAGKAVQETDSILYKESHPILLLLCRSAASTIPADCFSKVLSKTPRVHLPDIATICSLEKNELLPKAECMLELLKKRHPVSPETMFRVCTGEAANVEVGRCVRTVPDHFTDEQIIALCADCPSSTDAIQCIALLGNMGYSDQVSIRLCTGLTSKSRSIAVECINEMQHHSKAHTFRLCNFVARHTSPPRAFECIKHLGASPHLDVKDRIRLCSNDEIGYSSHDCLAEISFRYRLPFELPLLISLCENVSNNATVACFNEAPLSFTTVEKTAMCQQAINSAPQECASSLLTHGIKTDSSLVIDLCATASDLSSTHCFLEIHMLRINEDIALHFCKELYMDSYDRKTAIQCMSSYVALGVSRFLTMKMLHDCSNAVPVPTVLRRLSAPIESILSFTSLPEPIVFQLLNQFGFPLNVSKADGLYVRLLNNEKVEFNSYLAGDLYGVVQQVFDVDTGEAYSELHFEKLTLNAPPGNYSLAFKFNRAEYSKVEVFRIPVQVMPNYERLLKLLSGCDSLLHRLRTPNDESMASSDIFKIPFPWSTWVLNKECASSLEKNGLTLNVNSLGGKLVCVPFKYARNHVSVHVGRGIVKIVTGVGIPNDSMLPHELLKILPNASAKEIKRGYYQASIEWHPDKWVDHSELIQKRVHDIFQLIIDARTKLTAELVETCDT